jgi:hypothetical protein
MSEYYLKGFRLSGSLFRDRLPLMTSSSSALCGVQVCLSVFPRILIVWTAVNTFMFLGGTHTVLYVLLFWRLCKCVLLHLFLSARFKIPFMYKIIPSAHRINQSMYRNLLFSNRSVDTSYSPIDLSAHPILQSICRHTLFPNRFLDTPYSAIDLSTHPILQSIFRHTLFPNRSLGTSYSPIDLSEHSILHSICRHTLFSNRSLGTPYSPIDLSAHTILQSISRHTLFSNRSLGTRYSPIDLSAHPKARQRGGYGPKTDPNTEGDEG